MSLPSAYEIQNYAEAAAWLLFGVLLAQAIWQRRDDGDDDSEQYDWATLTTATCKPSQTVTLRPSKPAGTATCTVSKPSTWKPTPTNERRLHQIVPEV